MDKTNLIQQLTSSYRSCDGSSQVSDDSGGSTCDLNRNCDSLPKDVLLRHLASGSPGVLDRSPSSLTETDSSDPFRCICALSAIFTVAVTVALLLHILLWDSLVVKGVVVSDHERCTALGHTVLHDGGSSVDAAITAALCLGIVHPHVSGVGGGGVMLVHDINKNQTRLIDFQGAAPQTLKEDLLQNMSELKAGVQVGVPGELRGLHCAHSLYGRLMWEDVVTRAAVVAEEGFNVSFSLSEAISEVKGEQLSRRFRDTFLPGGLALLPGSFLRMSGLARVLQAGVSNFYDGNFSQELEEEVQSNGGVLSREDIRRYREQVEQPEEVLLNEFIIKVPPGAALISALNLLERLHLNDTASQTQHQITEALKGSRYNSSVTEQLSEALSEAEALLQRISPSQFLQTEPLAGRVAVMGPDGLVVSVASSLSTPFGSRIMTRSGVLLNSAIRDFSWLNRTTEPVLTGQKERRPPSALMPLIVVPVWCTGGIYLSLSSSGGQKSLTVITQVLISTLLQHEDRNSSLSLHPQPPVHPGFPGEKMKRSSVIQGILRSNGVFTALTAIQPSEHHF